MIDLGTSIMRGQGGADLLSKDGFFAYVDEEGRLVLPRELASRYGLKPGVRIHVDEKPAALSLGGAEFGEAANRCPFVDRGATAVTWDGSLVPCLLLLHDHISFPNGRERFSKRHIIGSLAARSLHDLWGDPAYVALRERVQMFDFSPCAFCGGCDLSETNEQDCIGNTTPTCGGCLWAQGLIQCP
jgi:hypothetical protein